MSSRNKIIYRFNCPEPCSDIIARRIKKLFYSPRLEEHKEFIQKEHASILNSSWSTSQPSKFDNFFVLVVTFSSLCEYSSHLSQQLLSSPQKTLAIFERTLKITFQRQNAKEPARCIVRISSLPRIPEVFRSSIPRSEDVGRFFALQCTVTRVGPIQVVQLERPLCCAQCGYVVRVAADFNQFYRIQAPRRCPNSADKCSSTTFNVVDCDDSAFLQSCQEIRVNEQFSCLAVGKMARSICVCVSDDMVDKVRPGDDVILNGVLVHRWRSPRPGSPCEIETVFRANYIENLSDMRYRGEFGGGDNLSREISKRFRKYWSSANGDFKTALRLRDNIVRSICPDVYGLFFVKLSLALMLVGAPPCLDQFDDNDPIKRGGAGEFRVRYNIHLLLLGEPSTAKSALLRCACCLAGRAVLTAATGTTAAGLTAAAVRDATSGWTLEAGALVLADGGVCAIDEFASLRGADRAAVHEAMEQQTVSIAKAGLVARLNCRCALLAASSLPGGGESGDLLPTPLLSRFDLVWRLFDPVENCDWDTDVAGFVLGFKRDNVHSSHWSAEELRQYISWVRAEFRPQLSSCAALVLQRYYELRRRILQSAYGFEKDTAIAGRTTLRLLESLVRLTQAHARLMSRDATCVEDAIVAVWLMDCSLQSTFGRCASAIEIDNHCVTPEETVTRQSMETSFDSIVAAVLQNLSLRPEEVSSEWFAKAEEDNCSLLQPMCASTQVSAPKLPGKGIPMAADNFDTIRDPQNAFDFDVDSFMPTATMCEVDHSPASTLSMFSLSVQKRFPPIWGLAPSDNSGKTTVSEFSLSRKKSSFSEEAAACLEPSVEITDVPSSDAYQIISNEMALNMENETCVFKGYSQIKPANKEAPSVTPPATPKRPRKSSRTPVFTKRMRTKLSKFAFPESDDATPALYDVAMEGNGTIQPKSVPEQAPTHSKPKMITADSLNFTHMAPDDWGLANINIDFDI